MNVCFEAQSSVGTTLCENRFERNYVTVFYNGFDRDVSMRNEAGNENEGCG